MKKLILFMLFMLSATSLSFGQRTFTMEQWYKDVVKARISALIHDSLDASGWQGTGLSDVDSIALSGEMRINGVVSYDQMLSIKNDAVNSKVQSWYNSRGTLLASVDSAGVVNGDTLVIDNAARIGGLVDYTSRVSIKGGAAHANLLKVTNEDGTARLTLDSAGAGTFASSVTAVGITTTGSITATSQTIASGAITSSGKSTLDSAVVNGAVRVGGLVDYNAIASIANNATLTKVLTLANSRKTVLWQVDSNGVVYSSIAGIDSFTTTAAADSVLLPAGSGLTNFSRVTITNFNPVHSTDVDTAIYSGQVVVTGDGDTMLVVTRAKSYVGDMATAVKSGGHYYYDIKK